MQEQSHFAAEHGAASSRTGHAQSGRSGNASPSGERLLRGCYYLLKPYIPWSVRVQLRRMRAKRRREMYGHVWPVDPSAGEPPVAWRGWPDHKQFAVVLSHDVEGSLGVARCEQLAAIEKSVGFRSSFNFIPEGEYRVSTELRALLNESGFEVGVHDLHHDGKLYRSEASFKESARKINEYLREWKAVGFRSGFMHHNLDWIRQLDVLYDASTFDTDPFEPQPDGARTIFPFWVTGGAGRPGYVELPYTLAQDFTMFVVLQERTIDIWKRKLDWVAERGGMALVNVHPDYVTFNGSPGPGEFKAELYRELLEYISQKHRGLYWPALPRDLARYIADNKDMVEQETLS